MIKFIKKFFSKKEKIEWEYGTCNGGVARRHITKGNVQFILWKAGENRHKEDYWHDMGSSWWVQFKPNT